MTKFLANTPSKLIINLPVGIQYITGPKLQNLKSKQCLYDAIKRIRGVYNPERPAVTPQDKSQLVREKAYAEIADLLVELKLFKWSFNNFITDMKAFYKTTSLTKAQIKPVMTKELLIRAQPSHIPENADQEKVELRIFKCLLYFCDTTSITDTTSLLLIRENTQIKKILEKHFPDLPSEKVNKPFKWILENIPKGSSQKKRTSEINKFFHLKLRRLLWYDCDEIQIAKWTPQSPISDLMSALQQRGPLLIGGFFGKPLYTTKPTCKKKPTWKRDIYYWKKGAYTEKQTKSAHCIVITGVDIKKHHVYYVDPNEQEQVGQRGKLYMISYKSLCKHASTIYGIHGQTNPSFQHYALYGDKKKILALHSSYNSALEITDTSALPLMTSSSSTP